MCGMRSASRLLDDLAEIVKRMIRFIGFLIAVLLFPLSGGTQTISDPRFDWEVLGATVEVVEASYMPDLVTFQLDRDAGACPKGTWINWTGAGNDAFTPSCPQASQANVTAVFSMLMAAKLSRNPINLFGRDTGCVANYIHLW